MCTIPDFTKANWHVVHSDDQLVRSVREGKGFMPAMKDKIGAPDVVKLVGLVRGFRGGRQVVPEDAQGRGDPEEVLQPESSSRPSNAGAGSPRLVVHATRKTDDPTPGANRNLFQRFCASCHGADGQGTGLRARVPSLPDFTSPPWHQQRTDTQLRTSILEGKGTAMPAFSSKLSDTEVRNLVAYLRSFVPGPTRPVQQTADDFEQRYRQLQDQLNELKRQYRALSPRD